MRRSNGTVSIVDKDAMCYTRLRQTKKQTGARSGQVGGWVGGCGWLRGQVAAWLGGGRAGSLCVGGCAGCFGGWVARAGGGYFKLMCDTLHNDGLNFCLRETLKGAGIMA